jgi:hypothetical protein
VKKVFARIAALFIAASLLAYAGAWLAAALYPKLHWDDRLRDAGTPGAILLVLIGVGGFLSELPVVGAPRLGRPRRPEKPIEAQESVAAEAIAKQHAEEVEARRRALEANTKWVVPAASGKPRRICWRAAAV